MEKYSQSSNDTIESCLERIRLAWNVGNTHAYAAEFCEDATYVIFLGAALVGREQIELNHAGVLTKWQKGSHMIIKVIANRPLGDDAASILTVGGIGTGSHIKYDKMQTFTMVRRDGRWMCSAFQNTKMNLHAKRTYNTESAPQCSSN